MCVAKKNRAKGFTLIELLVVISIIGILASVVLASLNGARTSAQDTRRKSELNQIRTALELYHNKYGTYAVSGSGWNGLSVGWFNYEGGVYVKSIARALHEEGLLPAGVDDPVQNPGYMMYVCNGGRSYNLYATLNFPSTEDLAKAVAGTCSGAYTTAAPFLKNYTVSNP